MFSILSSWDFQWMAIAFAEAGEVESACVLLEQGRQSEESGHDVVLEPVVVS
ncbi:MAG: hypothetical protein HQL91_00050 [Magnetococcales bacterium]|nr:hypothetical protein [Magnetococcales bacterium]